jgi:YD repeat-containing protein
MKKKLLFATAMVAVLAFSSCKKDDPTPGGGTNPPKEKRLKKITKTEAGVTTVFNLSYNAAGKLLSYKTADNSEFVNFTYDAAGNLTGIEQKEQEFKNLYLYTYANNLPVSAAFKSWDIKGATPVLIEDDQLTYTVENNKVSKIKLTMSGGGEANFNLSYANGELSKVTSVGAFAYSVDLTYGTKKSMYPKVSNWVLDQAGFQVQFASGHDILKVAFDFPGTALDYTIDNTNTYDANGYVLTSTDGFTQQVFEYE